MQPRRLERYDSLIRYHAATLWPESDWRFVKAVALAESSLDPRAVSPSGAVGLMQVMPATFAEIAERYPRHVPTRSAADPDSCLAAGILYLREQYNRFPEIPSRRARLAFALASYNAGRGYVNRALVLARKDYPKDWRRWEIAAAYLAHPRCTVAGKRPDYRAVWEYVDRVLDYYDDLRNGATATAAS